MLVVLSAYLGRRLTNHQSWGVFEVFDPGLVGLRESHLELAIHAVREDWDESVHVIQDDVTTRSRPGPHRGEVTSYHPAKSMRSGWISGDHVCPRSFSATGPGWKRLVKDWSRVGRTCDLWSPDFVYSTDPERNRQLIRQ